MSRRKVWLVMCVASLINVALFNGEIEHFAACVWFSAWALFTHWLFDQKTGLGKDKGNA